MSAPAIMAEPRVAVFISYSTADSEKAARLRAHIEGNGVVCSIAEKDIRAQSYWQTWIEERIKACQLCLLLFSNASRDSQEVRNEIDLAVSAGKEIWVVELEPARVVDVFRGYPFMERQFFRPYQGDERSSFQEILDKINGRWPVRDRFNGKVAIDNCPYPGPAPFSKDFADFFFGRHEATRALKEAVNGEKRVLLVWGPSGAGKTSLLTVGLVRELPIHYFYSGPVDGSSAQVLLARLEAKLTRVAPSESQAQERGGAGEIVRAIETRPENEFLFCFDQMENFFTWPPPTINEFLFCFDQMENFSSRTKLQAAKDDAVARTLAAFPEIGVVQDARRAAAGS
jgi:hypothetical protein